MRGLRSPNSIFVCLVSDLAHRVTETVSPVEVVKTQDVRGEAVAPKSIQGAVISIATGWLGWRLKKV